MRRNVNSLKKQIKKFNNILLETFQIQTLERNLRILGREFGSERFKNLETSSPRFLNIIQNHSIIQVLGRGSNAIAYELKDGTVLKVGNITDRELETYEAIQNGLFKKRGSGNDLMIYDFGVIGAEDFAYALMEKLIPLNFGREQEYDEEYEDEINFKIRDFVHDRYLANKNIFGPKSMEEIKSRLFIYLKKEDFFNFGDYQIELLEKWIEYFKNLYAKQNSGLNIGDIGAGNIGNSKRGKKVQFDF